MYEDARTFSLGSSTSLTIADIRANPRFILGRIQPRPSEQGTTHFTINPPERRWPCDVQKHSMLVLTLYLLQQGKVIARTDSPVFQVRPKQQGKKRLHSMASSADPILSKSHCEMGPDKQSEVNKKTATSSDATSSQPAMNMMPSTFQHNMTTYQYNVMPSTYQFNMVPAFGVVQHQNPSGIPVRMLPSSAIGAPVHAAPKPSGADPVSHKAESATGPQTASDLPKSAFHLIEAKSASTHKKHEGHCDE